MTASLELVSFGLPDSFPPERVPRPLTQFVAACVPGLSKGQLLSRTRKLEWRPIWKRMATFDTPDQQAFELTLTVSNVVVGLIVRMRVVGAGTRPLAVQERDPRQLSLF
ncbi:hypothetical protein [Burkholderia cenocepacia]|uniref:hypothetical protein n=1 Tax=Burkholderia cenocepacia TaxID=95486 RepID=UPI002AB61C11|nr:hypothetical protein [Burkholderia cenocepacia]